MESAGSQGLVCGGGGHPESVFAAQPHVQNLVARDGDEWQDVTASFSEILVPIAEFLRRALLWGRKLKEHRRNCHDESRPLRHLPRLHCLPEQTGLAESGAVRS